MHRIILAKTAGLTLIEMMVVMAVVASLAATAVPGFITFRDRSRVAQTVGSCETIRSAFASYAAGNAATLYPPTDAITDFDSLRLVVNANGGVLPVSAGFSVAHYDLSDKDGDGVADTYSLRLIVNGVSSSTTGAQILITPQGIFKCTLSGNPC